MLFAKKIAFVLLAIMLQTGCVMQSGRIKLMSLDTLWGSSTPSSIKVSKGDTLYSISRRYNIPIRDIIETNHLPPPYTLYVGRVLKMPTARYHVVEHGDTLYSISRKYNVDVTSLSKLNNLREPYTLKINQKLALPASVASDYSNNESTSQWSSQKTKSSNSNYSQRKTTTSSSYSKAKPTAYRKNKFAWPVKGTVISKYGTIGKGRSNDGINIKAPLGTVVKAADAGKVAYAGNELKGFGNLVLIKHSDGYITAYAHVDKMYVKKGQKVIRGEKIATVGSTGSVKTPQLHFEVRAGKKAVNPKSYLP
jgi:murein DD-endopeptidase MepM/ murein hydrolase activator NlpD